MSASCDVGPDILCTTGLAKRRIFRSGLIVATMAAFTGSTATASYAVQTRSVDSTSRIMVAQAASYQPADSVPGGMVELGLRVAAPPPLPSGLSERHLWMVHETAALLAGGGDAEALQNWRTLVLSARSDGLLRGRAEVEATSLWILREAFVEPEVELRWIADVLLVNSSQEKAALDRLEAIRSDSDRDRGADVVLVEEYLGAAAAASDGAAADLTRVLKTRHDITSYIMQYYNMMNTYDPEVRFTD